MQPNNNNRYTNFDISDNDGDTIDIREIVDKYLGYWKWFLLSSLVFLLIAYINLNFKRKVYESNSVIKIKNEQGGDRTTLSAFQDLGVLTPSTQNAEDEMEILLSKDLINEVIKALKLNVQIFSDKNKVSNFFDTYLGRSTNFYEKELYKKSPIDLNFLVPDSTLYNSSASFIIHLTSSNNFIFEDYENAIKKKYSFGEKVKTVVGDLIITPNQNKIDRNESLLVKITTVNRMSIAYGEKLKIEPKSNFSNILTLNVTDGTKEKANDFLTELVNKYNERAIRLKEELTLITSNFVDKRLEKISNELLNVDLTAESIKTKYRLSDAASQTSINLQAGQDIENRIVQTSAQIETISAIKSFVNEKGQNDLIPDVGVNDRNVNTSINQYNELMLRKKRLLENSTEKNPTVVNLDEQLKFIKSNIDQGLDNLEKNQRISLESLNKQDQKINSLLYSAPKQERQIRDIKRQQQIKEQLYLYLLQKREETAITIGIDDPNAKIIDSAKSLPNPVAPKKTRAYAGFIILGLVLTFSFLYLRELLDNKIHTREDVERVINNIPIIGDIPKLESKKPYLIEKNDYSSVGEAFRILRTNLNFIVPNNNNNKGKMIFVTSTIAHEGKSLVSSNLATSLSHAGLKTLLLGMDIRAPKIKSYFSAVDKKNIGVTNYLISNDIEPEDLISTHPKNENLHIIFSGDIAPNPAELMMHSKIDNLFQFGRDNYDYVIVDTAAFSAVTDTMIISKFSDAFIYVIRANYLDKRLLKYIKALYTENRLKNMAILLNSVDQKRGYGYGYGYGVRFESKERKKWKRFFS